jgi:hypothetical protein
VRFSLTSGEDANGLAGKLLNELNPHLEGTDDETLILREPAEAVPFLLIEDFGTRGLQGNPVQDEDVDSETGKNRNDFYYFWRNVGRSDKSEADRGRWGLGKIVHSISSEINTFWGLTKRITDDRKLLMGQCVLKIHKLDGIKYSPYGYFGQFEGEEENKFFALPIEDSKFIDNFSQEFSLQREEQPGLSIIIPYPRKEITVKQLCKSVIHQYFYPILSKDLIVEIQDDEGSTLLNDETISRSIEFIESMDGRSADCLQRLFSLSAWSINLPEANFIKLRGQDLNEAPSWNKIELDQAKESELREAFELGEQLAFRVPIKVQKKNKAPVESYFSIFLQRDDEAEAKEEFFIRQGITITGIWSFRDSGVRGLVVIDHRPLTALLGDAENPAHTDWQQRSSKFSAKYQHGSSCVGFVKRSLHEIIKKLSFSPKERDINLLKDLFYIDREILDNPSRAKKPKGKKTPGGAGGDCGIVSSRTPMIQVTRKKGGFSISPHPDAEDTPVSITIEMAYETRRGNPFKKYSPLDFDISQDDIKLYEDGVKNKGHSGNKLETEIVKPDFKIEFEGFDPNRDLRTRVIPVRRAKDDS